MVLATATRLCSNTDHIGPAAGLLLAAELLAPPVEVVWAPEPIGDCKLCRLARWPSGKLILLFIIIIMCCLLNLMGVAGAEHCWPLLDRLGELGIEQLLLLLLLLLFEAKLLLSLLFPIPPAALKPVRFDSLLAR